MDRRRFVVAALASPFGLAGKAVARDPIYIGDMHFHLFFFGRKPASSHPLARNMAAGNATLVSWSLVADVPWLRPTGGGFKQKGEPKAGEAAGWFKAEMGRVQRHIAEQKLKIVKTPEDIDRALGGDPHVVLSVEGAGFVDGDLSQLRVAYDLGIRHVQLVHFIRNQIGDMQTEKPQHNGLTEFGKQVVLECNRLGILVDLAHCSEAVVRQALAVSKVPMVWSHSSVQRSRWLQWQWSSLPWHARQLPYGVAKAITEHGGVIGLWALSADVGKTVESYADRFAELADWFGEDHVAFGTDMNGIASPALANYSDVRRVVHLLEQRKFGDARIRKLAIENYARVLRLAFRARSA